MINSNISYSQIKAVEAVHRIAYGEEARPEVVRERLKEFSGFQLDTDTEEYATRMTNMAKHRKTELIAACHILNLDFEGSIDVLADRICSFMNRLNIQEEDDEDNNDNEVENDDNHEDDEDEDEPLAVVQALLRPTTTNSFALTFRDIKDSIRPFSGI